MTSGVISPAKLFFFYLSPGPYRSIPGLYRVLSGLVPNSPSSYSSSLSFSHCPHRVHTASSEICNTALKYVLLLWNMYCHSEICIAAPKYSLPLRNMLSRWHVHVSKPSLYSTIWAPPHERVHNGLVPAPRPLTVLIPGSHRVPPLFAGWVQAVAHGENPVWGW